MKKFKIQLKGEYAFDYVEQVELRTFADAVNKSADLLGYLSPTTTEHIRVFLIQEINIENSK